MAQNTDISNGQLPLKGVILCCTALPQDVRTKLADIAIQMGAVHKLDLTSDVTHLIVGSLATPKYKYVAKERPDIKVLHSDWLEAVRALWIEGADVDVEALEQKHHFLPFTGLQICVTGFDNLDQRADISTTVEQQGAVYNGDLTKVVTHLIAAVPQGEKYNHAKRWGIHIVSLKWFEDSLQRGMAVDESFYDPSMPLEEQGKGAFKRQRTSLGKRRLEGVMQIAADSDGARKKLRRTASTRLESQSQDMWLGMSAEPVNAGNLNNDQWQDDESRSGMHTSEASSRSTFKTKSGAAENQPGNRAGAVQAANGLFSGRHILIHGFATSKKTLLEQVLQQNGASIAQSSSELDDASHTPFFKERYLLVPHVANSDSGHLPEVPAGTTTATEWWVERCIHYKKMLDPTVDALSRPLWDAEVPGFTDLLVSTTGLSGVDLRQIAETVKLMGATYQEKVLPTSSVLVSGSAVIRKEKAFYARKHSIPVVSASWLWACLEARKKVPFDRFTVALPGIDTMDFAMEHSTSSPAASGNNDGASKRKDDGHSKRLSSSRKTHATPTLSLQSTKANVANPSSKPKPLIHEDDEDSPIIDNGPAPATMLTTLTHRASQPLQEVSTNYSPRKTSSTSSKEGNYEATNSEGTADPPSRAISPAKPSSTSASPQKETQSNTVNAQPASRTHHELTADLADILNRQSTSRPSSARPAEPPQPRKRGPLGRASSGTSNRPLSGSASVQADHFSPALVPEGDAPASEGLNAGAEMLSQPSTQLGYETLETEAHRMQMSRKMGTKLQDDADMRRLPSLGVVKDTPLSADAGVGNRLKERAKGRARGTFER